MEQSQRLGRRGALHPKAAERRLLEGLLGIFRLPCALEMACLGYLVAKELVAAALSCSIWK